MEIIYQDNRILVCLKPFGVVSTDEPGGLPDLVRQSLGGGAQCVRTVHRLDQVVGGVMVLARSRAAARILSEQVAARQFEKEYLAVLEGVPEHDEGELRDLLGRDKAKKLTYVADAPGKGRAGGRPALPPVGQPGWVFPGEDPPADRAHPSDPLSVFLPGPSSCGGLQVRGPAPGDGGHRPVVPLDRLPPSADRRAGVLSGPAAPDLAVDAVPGALDRGGESLKQIAIIGGGASGLAAALSAARTDPKAEITVLEGLDRVGKKILATGNGRCNLTNSDLANAHYHSSQPELLGNFLAEMPTERTLDFFRSLGLWCAEEELGRIYPNARQASAVLDVLLNALEHSGVRVECGVKVKNAARTERGFRLTAEDGRAFFADAVVLCGRRTGRSQAGDGRRRLCPRPAAGPQLSPALSVSCAAEMRGAGFEGLKGGSGPRYRCADPERHGARKGKRRDTVHRLRPVRHSDFSALLPAGTGRAQGRN